jgi:hypothetical protein
MFLIVSLGKVIQSSRKTFDAKAQRRKEIQKGQFLQRGAHPSCPEAIGGIRSVMGTKYFRFCFSLRLCAFASEI